MLAHQKPDSEKNKMTKQLSVLLVEDSDFRLDSETKAIKKVFPEYSVQVYNARNYSELRQKLQEGHYDLAFVDFDMGEGGWRGDAIQSAYLIDNSQPGCVRIGISIDSIIESLNQFRDWGRLKDIYHITIGRDNLEKRPDQLREKLKKHGF